ncbi:MULTISPECIES: exostosin family protein [unclassified Variovorax]|uniref:exostosin domain-containing protein n=1 Tax=unclassified Variovorax TaxID=663243 RepID=UPI00257603D5|nr:MULTISPECIES: exostosin family protein [unclassified Variovorax]MDM0087403.1 exostosin family protein [Variovorax sp. J22G40]MDM0144340.1 exostosin family protein [Variovorax sp. J2P1-31]
MKLRFLTPADTPLASADPQRLDALRAELLTRPGVVEVGDIEEADALILHEPWAFREWRYIDMLVADPVVGRFAHKVYTLNEDDAAAGLLRGLYTCLQRSRFDPKLHAAIPFVAQPNEEVAAQAGTPRPPATLLATWRGNPKSNRKLRQGLLDVCSRSPAFKAESTESWLNHGPDEKRRYVELLRSGKFSLCPGGWAPASMRVFESMALGVAPAILADEFVEPPGPDWRSLSVKVPEAELATLQQRLEARAAEHLAMGEAAHRAWQVHFSPERIFPYYADALLALIRNADPGGSAEAEFARWRSPRMARLNGWTLPQRIANKLTRVLEKVRH